MVMETVVLCIFAFYIQNTAAQCIGTYNTADSLAWGPWGASAQPYGQANIAASYGSSLEPRHEWSGYTPGNLAASHGGGLTVTSSSPIAPTGVAMTSENAYEGVLGVNGAIPFLAAVSMEGIVPTAGAGETMYGCGNGNVAILSEDINLGSSPGASYNGVGPVGYQAGIPGPATGYNTGRYGGCGYGTI